MDLILFFLRSIKDIPKFLTELSAIGFYLKK